MYIKKSRGFTIIELLVVIALIAALAAIVLINVTSYINKSKNSAIKGNMATLLINGAVFFDEGQTYDGFDTNTNKGCLSSVLDAVTNAGGALTCFVKTTDDFWCACSTLNVTGDDPVGSTWCVDSTGVKKQTLNDCSTECTDTTGTCL